MEINKNGEFTTNSLLLTFSLSLSSFPKPPRSLYPDYTLGIKGCVVPPKWFSMSILFTINIQTTES